MALPVDVARLGGLRGALSARLASAVGLLLGCLGAGFLDRDGESLAGDTFAVNIATGTTYVECAFDIGLDDVGEACGDGTGHLSVHDGHVGLVRDVGAGEHREPFEGGASEVVGTAVYLKADFESASLLNTARGTDGQLLSDGGKAEGEE